MSTGTGSFQDPRGLPVTFPNNMRVDLLILGHMVHG